ncbi:decarboxylase [Candidatus Pacearchaeota archaeon]|nr:decarboxylase [Candidatus Pacearchaeota archaeon]
MKESRFILSKQIVFDQIKKLLDLKLKISYSYKTNREVGNILQEKNLDVGFSIHAFEEIGMIKDKSKISFFTQAESEDQLKELFKKGIRSFVIDNEIDLERLLKVVKEEGIKINLSLRMKFQEHRIGSGKYFVYGIPAKKINEIITRIKNNSNIDKLGIHIHRKSQNTSEWEIQEEIQDSLTQESLERINIINLGGGLPSVYRSYTSKVLPYIFEKLVIARKFLEKYDIETIIEPGRFVAAPAVKLETEIIQIYDSNIIINTTLYNCALDTVIGQHKMLVEGELEKEDEGKYYLIKGNSPTRDDIFRYKVKLKNPKVGDKITFLNAGAYNYTTDFFGYKKLQTKIGE